MLWELVAQKCVPLDAIGRTGLGGLLVMFNSIIGPGDIVFTFNYGSMITIIASTTYCESSHPTILQLVFASALEE